MMKNLRLDRPILRVFQKSKDLCCGAWQSVEKVAADVSRRKKPCGTVGKSAPTDVGDYGWKGFSTTGSGGGFTAIEVIGVVTVIALLAAAIIPQVIRRIDQAALTKETADLNTIADSYTQSALRTKTLPGLTTWASSVASQMNLPASAIATNARGHARAFLIDPNLSISNASLPYTQTTNGTAKPSSARVILVSSLARALPVILTNSTEFNAIWDTPEGAKPATSTWTTWPGKADDLRIKKLNLEPLFYQLILVNHDPVRIGKYDIDGSAAQSVTTNGLGWNSYYLDGSVVGLRDENANLQTRYLLKRSISFIFDSGAWSGQPSGGLDINPLAPQFASQASSFYHSTNNPVGNNKGASMFSVLVLLYSFMYDYTLWANECPHFDPHGLYGSGSPELTLLKTIVGPTANGSLGDVSGPGGLLK